MNSKNNRYRDILGVTAWHNAGYTGSRGLTVTGEDIVGDDEHAYQTRYVFHEIAPDRRLIYRHLTASYIKGKYYHGILENLDDMISQGADVIYASLTDKACNVKMLNEGLERIKDDICIMFAAGNDNSKSSSRIIGSDYVWGVGAYKIMVGSNEFVTENYSSLSEHVDFAAPARLYVGKGKDENYYGQFVGTSCATPVLAGMASLVNDMAIHITGKPLTQQGMYDFFKDNCKDMSTAGKDVKTGWGAVILPDPSTVDIKKYQYRKDNINMSEIYADWDSVGVWAQDAVKLCYEKGLIKGGSDGRFRPTDGITRQEMAVILSRLVEQGV